MDIFFIENRLPEFLVLLRKKKISVDEILDLNDSSMAIYILNNLNFDINESHLKKLHLLLKKAKGPIDFKKNILQTFKKFSFEEYIKILPFLKLNDFELEEIRTYYGYNLIYKYLKGYIGALFEKKNEYQIFAVLCDLIDSPDIIYSLSLPIYDRLIYYLKNDIIEYNFIPSLLIYSKIFSKVDRNINLRLLEFLLDKLRAISIYIYFENEDINIVIDLIQSLIEKYEESKLFYNLYLETLGFLKILKKSTDFLREEKLSAETNLNIAYILYTRAFDLGNRLFLPDEIEVIISDFFIATNRFFKYKYLLTIAFKLQLEYYLNIDLLNRDIAEVTDFSILENQSFTLKKMNNFKIPYLYNYIDRADKKIQLNYIEYLNEKNRTDLLFLYSYRVIQNSPETDILLKLLLISNGNYYDFNNKHRRTLLLNYIRKNNIKLDIPPYETNLLNLPIYILLNEEINTDILKFEDYLSLQIKYSDGNTPLIKLAANIYFDRLENKDYKYFLDYLIEEKEYSEFLKNLYKKKGVSFKKISENIKLFEAWENEKY